MVSIGEAGISPGDTIVCIVPKKKNLILETLAQDEPMIGNEYLDATPELVAKVTGATSPIKTSVIPRGRDLFSED